MKLLRLAIAVVSLSFLSACGNGSGGGVTASGGSNLDPVTNPPGVVLVLKDQNTGLASTSTPANAVATVTNTDGTPLANAVVTFSIGNAALASINPSTATALTNSLGQATVGITSSGLSSGATTITAASQFGSPVASYSSSVGFSVGAANVNISTPIFGAGVSPLSAFGTTSISVTVTSNGVPVATAQTVTFSSVCASAGKASISATGTTTNGVATSSYHDNGCAGNDTITATVSGMATASAILSVTAPTVGSLQFVSSTPQNLSLKGIGGIEVVDVGGNPLSGKTVSFDLSTSIGGIYLTPAAVAPSPFTTTISDSAGLATVTINAGVISTPVRVIAKTSGAGGVTLTSQSSGLTITTGIPDNNNISLSSPKFNFEGWNIDGAKTTITARLADHFQNPIPDGTVINFTAEGGLIVGSCQTVSSACTATFTSQNLRPTNGRVTVLAWALGNEGFTDVNGNGVADLAPNEMVDANGQSTDMPEAYVDYNENGIRDANEPFFDLNGNGIYDGADGQYNGVLCNSSVSSSGTCSSTKMIDIREQAVIVMSSSSPDTIGLIKPSGAAAASVLLPACDTTPSDSSMPVQTYKVRVVDIHGNAMPAGTTISFAISNGSIVGTNNYVVPDTNGCNSLYPGCPNGSANFETYSVSMKSDASMKIDASVSSGCNNTSSSGVLTVTVKTPGENGVQGVTTETSFVVID
jgi:hypothetical protein